MDFSTIQGFILKKNELLKDISFCKNLEEFYPYFKKSKTSRLLNHRSLKIKDYTIRSIQEIILGFILKPNFYSNDDYISLLSEQYKLDGKEGELFEKIKSCFENLFSPYNKIVAYMDGLLRKKRFEDVLQIYRDHLTPRYFERKNWGQVYTPFYLICRILNQIPDEIWKDKNSKFFDPAAGMGGFLVIVYHKLMFTLKEKITDEKQRHDHIIRNMLYAADIDEVNISWMRKIFGSHLHVYHGDTLSTDILQYFGVQGFQVIVGNPPFEKPQTKDTRRNAGDSLWIDFVWKSLTEWIAPNGYFGMLLPPGWRKPSDENSRSRDIWRFLSVENTPLWIEMYDAKESKELFDGNASIRFDLVFLKNRPNYHYLTKIKQTNGAQVEKILSGIPYLPNNDLKYWFKLFHSKHKHKVDVLYSSSVYRSDKQSISREKTPAFKYKVIHSIHKDGKIVYLYTNKKIKEGGFGIPKIIFNRFGGWNKPILDLEGKYGMSQDTFGIKIDSKEEGDEIIKYFNLSTLKKFEQDMSWATSKPTIFWKMFYSFPRNFYDV